MSEIKLFEVKSGITTELAGSHDALENLSRISSKPISWLS